MGAPKGKTRKYWTPEEKYEVIKPILKFEKSSAQVTRETGISNGMICNWIKSYKENDDNFIDNRYKRGNPLSKYSKRKNLSDIEKLQYENMKLRIENERLKKGYLMRGDGSIVVFKK